VRKAEIWVVVVDPLPVSPLGIRGFLDPPHVDACFGVFEQCFIFFSFLFNLALFPPD